MRDGVAKERRTRSVLKRYWFTLSGAAFGVLFALLYKVFGATEGTLMSFDFITLLLLLAFARMVQRASIEDQPNYAVAQLRGRRVVRAGSVFVSLIILFALSVELRPPNSLWEISLSVVSLVLSWLFFNCVYALYYASAYYTAEPNPGGLHFPGTSNPTYSDFVYFSFVLGTTFQVSDVQITSQAIRRVALVHGVLSFFFNAVVIALTVNAISTPR